MRYLLLVLSFVIMPFMALSHALVPSAFDIEFGDGTYTAKFGTAVEALIAEIEPEVEDTNESANAERYNALREMSPAELEAEFNDFQQEFAESIHIIVDGVRQDITITGIEIPEVGDTEILRISAIEFEGVLPDASEEMTVQVAEEYGQTIVRVTLPDGERGYSGFMQPGQVTDPISLITVTDQPFWRVFTDYIPIGFEHIIPLGLDHILFVVGLFLLSMKLHALLWQVSAFTVAHTITLALGMLGIVSIPGSIVEPLIAASIVYVCIENIVMKGFTRWRTVVVFMFGLLHGLGFAGVLTEFGLPKGQFVSALIGFNIGVELGQLAVIAICFAAFGYWFGKKDWYRRAIVIPMSLSISVIASYWFYERVFL